MFKSVFVKYISAFMLINILSIFLSTSIITTLVNIYDESNKSRMLENIAFSSVEYIVEDYAKSGEITFSSYLNNSAFMILPYMSALSTNSPGLVIFVSDVSGNVKLVGGSEESETYAGGDGVIQKGEELRYPDSVWRDLQNTNHIMRQDTLGGFFEEEHQTYFQKITTKEGRVVGAVMACTMDSEMDELLETMVKTIIMSTLWLMLAALIAIYFITERLVSPLRAMNKASREFASGHFDARVTVNGNDEVAELADAFNVMANSLQHSEETRRLFLANVSHDLRTPMTTITGFIDSIISGAIPQDKVPHYLEVISGEVKRLSRLVGNLLDITKIQAGERKFNMTPFDICEMAQDILASSEQRLAEKNLQVVFEADRKNMYVNGDDGAIHQVLYNICDNAIKFAEPAGKYVVTVKDQGSKVEIGVYNEGSGIQPEDLPYVFDRFYKSDKSRGLDKTGVGLGLYISRTIIEAHNEKIKVESEYGKWCRFSFTLSKTSSQKLTEEKKNGEGIG